MAALALAPLSPPTNLVTAGILNSGNMQNWQGVVSGPSYSFSANIFVGYQGSFSSSGKVGGPSITPGIGLSGSYTIGGCGPAPGKSVFREGFMSILVLMLLIGILAAIWGFMACFLPVQWG